MGPLREIPGSISVLMPARNASGTLAIAIRSTLIAMSKEDELIVIVEPQDLGTRRVLEGIRDIRLRVSISTTGSSVVEKLTQGLALAKWHLVARMDADDISLPWRFKMQKRRMRRNDLDFCFSTCIVFGKALRPIPVLPQPLLKLKQDNFLRALIASNPAAHPTMLAKRESIESLGGYRDIPGEDLDLWLRAAIQGMRFERTATPAILYRYRKTSLSRDQGTKDSIRKDMELLNMRLVLLARQRVQDDIKPNDQLLVGGEGDLTLYRKELKRKFLFKLELLDLGLNH